MGYGAQAKRAAALGGAVLTDVDIFKIALLCQAERGFSGVVQDQIYSMNDYYLKCGGFGGGDYGAYVAKSFFDELEKNLSCEMKVLSYVGVGAAQAAYSIMDGALVPVKIFDVKAGRKNVADTSAFGNKIAIKIAQVETLSLKLTVAVSDTDTTAYLNGVDNLKVGHYIRFSEGSAEEVRVITDIDVTTKKVTFAAISESGGFSISGCTVTRIDWKITVYVKDELGNYQKKEIWEGPFAKSDTIGLAADVNDTINGSDFIILAVNSSNASAPEDQIPAELVTETALTGGADGAEANDAAWLALAEAYLVDTEFTFLLAPESSSVTHNQNMEAFCTDDYKGMYYAQSSNEASQAILQDFGANMRGGIVFAMCPGDKWIRVNDPTVLGGTKDIPKVGVDAAFWFNTYYRFGESKVAAGNKPEMILKTKAKLLDSNGLVHDDRSSVGQRMIEDYSINICKFTRGRGITNNSARTFSTDGGYMYQNQIMQFILYMRSILVYLRSIEQDRSGANAMESHKNVVTTYMKRKWKAGHLFTGQNEDGSFTTFEDVCIIINDFTINTLARIANGEEETFLQFVAVPPIEKPTLSLASAAATTIGT